MHLNQPWIFRGPHNSIYNDPRDQKLNQNKNIHQDKMRLPETVQWTPGEAGTWAGEKVKPGGLLDWFIGFLQWVTTS